MSKWLLLVLSAALFAAPSLAAAQDRECACVRNDTNRDINFRYWYKDEDGIVRTADLAPNRERTLCWSEGIFGIAGSRREVFVEMDVDMTGNIRNQTTRLELSNTSRASCSAIPSRSHYSIRFEPSNPNAITLVGGGQGNYAPAYPAPYYPPGAPSPYPPAAGTAPYPPAYPAPPVSSYPPAPGAAYPRAGYPAPAYPAVPPGYPPPAATTYPLAPGSPVPYPSPATSAPYPAAPGASVYPPAPGATPQF